MLTALLKVSPRAYPEPATNVHSEPLCEMNATLPGSPGMFGNIARPVFGT